MRHCITFLTLISLICFTGLTTAEAKNHSGTSPLEGVWEVIPELSPGVDRHSRRLKVEIRMDGDQVTLKKTWGRRGGRSEELELVADGKARTFPVESRFSLTTVYSALHARAGDERTIAASLEDSGRQLVLELEYPVDVAQGRAVLKERQIFRANTVEPMLHYTIKRTSRPDESEETYTFKAEGSMEAHVVYLEDNWEVAGDLQRQAALIALQGLANRDGPNLYLVYPDTWQFNYSGRLMEWYEEERGYSFKELEGLAEALDVFREKLDGYVIWDKEVRNSLNVAFTIAGLENAVPVTEDQLEIVEALGLEPVADLRGLFVGMTDAELYGWARDRYWDRCSRKHLIWMGGHSGAVMKPGVADWGVAQRVFFQDLSCRASDTEEFQMASELLADMDEDALIMGWHSYAKDRESEHVSLCSSFGLPVLGLHSNPNVSFENQIGFSEGFAFENNHNVEPDEEVVPENKVYLAAIQTDSIGIGAWLKPGRGEIPYAWEVTMNYSWLVPSLLEFFYSTATPNDYFVGALSGPGYMYPKSVPEDKLPGLIERANGLMESLDLRVFDIMDYSISAPEDEWADLTLPVIEAYYDNMPQAIGFVNGYVPANTYYHKDGRAMISFEYYLSPMAGEDEAVADLVELGRVNRERPYYLLLHIRETNTIERVKGILDRLPDDFELVPLDVFMKMAAHTPGFTERYVGNE